MIGFNPVLMNGHNKSPMHRHLSGAAWRTDDGFYAMVHRIKLIDSDGGLLPLAPFVLLGAMIYPHDATARRALMRHLNRSIAEAQLARPKLAIGRPSIAADDILSDVKAIAPGAAIAGLIFIRLVEASEAGTSISVNKAIDRLSNEVFRERLPSRQEQVEREIAMFIEADLDNRGGEPLPTLEQFLQPLRGHMSKAKMLKAWHRFRPVAPLWATYVDTHGGPISSFVCRAESWQQRGMAAKLWTVAAPNCRVVLKPVVERKNRMVFVLPQDQAV